MTAINLEHVSRAYKSEGTTSYAVDDLSLEVEEGTVTALLGASGCGKSTTLRMLAGIDLPTSGRISIGEKTVFDASEGIAVPPNKRSIGMVFQSYALWPHLTVFDIVAYPRRRRRMKGNLREHVMTVLESVGCEHLAARYPYQLSGGQQQRIALARALSADPSVVLFDEPLSNLDAKLRDRLKYELKDLQRTLKFTAIYVTHDQEEALTLGHRCAIMRDGKIAQIGSPREIYSEPGSEFVFNFLGEARFFNGTVTGSDSEWTSLATASGVNLTARTRGRLQVGEQVRLGVRSEDIGVAQVGQGVRAGDEGNSLRASIGATYFAGDTTVATVRVGNEDEFRVRASHGIVGAEECWLRFNAQDAFAFPVVAG